MFQHAIPCRVKTLIDRICAPRTVISNWAYSRRANAELEDIDPLCRDLPEVLVIRFAIYHVVAKRLTEWNPKEPGNLLNLLMHPGA